MRLRLSARWLLLKQVQRHGLDHYRVIGPMWINVLERSNTRTKVRAYFTELEGKPST